LQGVDGVPQVIIVVVGGQNDLEFTAAGVGADEVRAIPICEERQAGISESGKELTP
jgi:hypothetical protein